MKLRLSFCTQDAPPTATDRGPVSGSGANRNSRLHGSMFPKQGVGHHRACNRDEVEGQKNRNECVGVHSTGPKRASMTIGNGHA